MKKLIFLMLLFFLVLSQCDSGYSQWDGGYGYGRRLRLSKTSFLIQSLVQAK